MLVTGTVESSFLVADVIISPPNIYMHGKCEVPGSKCGFTARN